MNNGRFINDGVFNPGSGSFIFSGNNATDQTIISGNGTLSFYNLLLNKSQNGLQLGRHITITNLLELVGGDSLYLNGYNIDLGSSGMVRGESANRYIAGSSGGYIQSTQLLNGPVNVNPGNMGLVISSTENLGSTVIRRGHVRQSDGFDIGISRYYDVIPTNNTSLQATIRFYYLDHELCSISENLLTSFISQNEGVNWSLAGFSARNTDENYVETTGFDQLFRHTLGSTEDPLPVKFLYIKTIPTGKFINVEWSTAQKEGNGEFLIQRSLGGNQFQSLGSVKVAGYSTSVQKYNWVDKAPQVGWNYYRILQVDERGSLSYSNVSQVIFKGTSIYNLLIFPNPAKDNLHIRFWSENESNEIITLLNYQGEKIFSRSIQIQKGLNENTYDIHTLPAGIYFLKVEGMTLSGSFLKQ
ncbi:MAG: T9SS type A sorting domain-containing protein [Chitinophagaceae bacterium]|nr:T9SS type A sorting domain-containing protein [Chitinophagaceae bacterium]